MSDMNLTLRIRADADGTLRVVNQVNQAVGQIGPQAQKSGREAEQGFSRARRGVESISTSLERMQRMAGAAFAGLVSFRTVNTVFQAVVSNTTQQEQALAQLEARIRSTGGAAGRSIEQLTDLSRELQNTTTFGNEAIEKMMGTLMTFTQVKGEQFDGATTAILNLSSALGTDLQSAALQVGKALNDPIQGVTALQRAGIQLNESQREQIRLMVQAGNVAGAQAIILAELELQFGGTAEAMRGTFGGALQSLRNAFDDLLKFEGEMRGLVWAIEDITARLQDPELKASIEGGLAAALESIPPLIDAMVTGLEMIVRLGPVLADGLTVVAAVVGTRLVIALGKASAAKLRNIGLAGQLAGSWSAAAVAANNLALPVRGLYGALALVGGPAGVAILAAGAVATLAMRARSASSDVEELESRVLALTERFYELNRRELQRGLDDVNQAIIATADELRRLEGVLSFRADNSAWADANPGSAAAQRIAADTAELERQAEAARLRLAELGEQGLALAERLDQAAVAASGAGRAVTELTGPLDKQLESLREQVIELTAGAAALQDYRDAQLLARAAEIDAEQRSQVNTQAVRAHIAERRRLQGAIEAQAEAEKAAAEARKRMAEQTSALQTMYQSLRAEIDPLGSAHEELVDQIEAFQASLALSADELQALGLDAATVEAILAELQRRLAALGQEDPFSDLRDSIQAQIEAYERGGRALAEWEMAQRLTHIEQSLGIELTAQQRAELEALLQVLDEAARAHDRLAGAVAGVSRSFGSGVQAMIAGDNVGRAIGDSLRMNASQHISAGLQEAFQGAFEDLAEKLEMDEGALAGYTLALGQALGGQIATAIGTALGTAIGGFFGGPAGAMIGASIGSAIGSIFDRQKDPKFQLGGVSGFARTGGTPRGSFDSYLGDTLFRFRNIEDETAQQIQTALVQFDRTIAGLIRDQGQMNLIDAAMRNFAYDSADDGASMTQLLQARFDAILRTFDAFTQAVVSKGYDLEEQVQRLADVFAIQTELFFRRDLGLFDLVGSAPPGTQPPGTQPPGTPPPGAWVPPGIGPDPGDSLIVNSTKDLAAFNAVLQGAGDAAAIASPSLRRTLELVDELARPSETLAEAFARLVEATGLLDVANALLSVSYAGARDDLIRFADQLTAVFGDDLAALSGRLGQVFETFFEADDLIAIQADQLRRRAIDLIGDLGIDATEEMLTRSGFKALFDDLYETLLGAGDAEGLALLIEAGGTIADLLALLDEPGAIAGAREREQLERRLLVLQGDTNALRALELAALDESNRALQQRIWALEDAAALDQLMSGVFNNLAQLSLTPLRGEFRSLTLAFRETMEAANALGAGERELAQIRMAHDITMTRLAGRLAESIRSTLDLLFGQPGQGGGLGGDVAAPVEQAAERIRTALIRALDGVDEWLRRSGFENPSLTPVSQLEAMQAEFDRLVGVARNGSGQEQADAIAKLPQLASQLEALGVRVFGSATEPFQEFRDGLVSAMESVAGIEVDRSEPVTGAQVGAIQASTEQMALTLIEQRSLAAQLLEEIGTLAHLTGMTVQELANGRLGDIIALLLGEVEEQTLATVNQLLAVAHTLGVDLQMVADEIGFAIGQLTDQDSLYSQALNAAVLSLPEHIQDELFGPLDRIWAAATDADATDALADLLQLTDALPAEYRNLLAPFFEQIDPVDYLLTQVGLLDLINANGHAQLGALAGIEGAVWSVADAIGSIEFHRHDSATEPPGFAAGGWVSGNRIIRAGEQGPELILPAPVSEFFQRNGVPVNAGGDQQALVERLERLIALNEAAMRQREEHSRDAQRRLSELGDATRESARATASAVGVAL